MCYVLGHQSELEAFVFGTEVTPLAFCLGSEVELSSEVPESCSLMSVSRSAEVG